LTRQATRACRWAALLPVLFAAALAAAQGTGPPAANGGYLDSRLVSANAQRSCPPGIGPMFRADAIVTGTDMRQRPWGFAETLREVLIKASGDPRLAHDPRIVPLAAQAECFVACFAYLDLMAGTPLHDDQGTYDRPHQLTVSFVPARIDALLAQLGDKPWRGERPVVVPVLLVRGRKLPPYLLSAEIAAGAEQRGAFAVAAGEFGMRARIPREAELLAWGADAGRLPSGVPPASAGEAVVVGTLDWRERLPGWVGEWRMRWRGGDYAWGIGGVNYDAAFRNIVSGVMLVASGACVADRPALGTAASGCPAGGRTAD